MAERLGVARIRMSRLNPIFVLSLALAVSACGGAYLGDGSDGAEDGGAANELPSEGGADMPSDAEIRQLLIEASIAAYEKSCPCPYNVAKDGKMCGDRSAYKREAGEKPLCYEGDVSDEMVDAYRESHTVN